MTKAQAVAKYLNEHTQYLKNLPEPFVEAIVSVLDHDDDMLWWRTIRTYAARPVADDEWIEETGKALKAAVKGLKD